MINRELIKSNAPKTIGMQIHINHKGCSAGEDTKKRLYIKRTVGGVLAYCHHCSEHGFVRDKTGDGDRLASWLKGKDVDAPRIEKTSWMWEASPLPMHCTAWIHSNHCTPQDGRYISGVRSDPCKVALCLRDPLGSPIGYQFRNLEKGAKPKYLTSYIDHPNRGDASWFHVTGNKILIITEDFLSAYRIHRDIPFISSVALLKTSISDRTLNQIATINFEMVFIWLDPDEAGIKGAKEAYKKLTYFLPTGTKVAILGYDKEPKQYTPAELREVLI